jgi:hypothetical protein
MCLRGRAVGKLDVTHGVFRTRNGWRAILQDEDIGLFEDEDAAWQRLMDEAPSLSGAFRYRDRWRALLFGEDLGLFESKDAAWGCIYEEFERDPELKSLVDEIEADLELVKEEIELEMAKGGVEAAVRGGTK